MTDTQRAQLDAIRRMDGGIERAQAVNNLAKHCGVSRDHVWAELGEKKGRAAQAVQGCALTLAVPELWPQPVDGALLLDGLASTFRRYLALPPNGDVALALWTLHAHAHNAAEVSPLLSITSPVMRCGKTTALHVLGALVPRPLPAANITTAALFRAVEALAPTLLIDEADTFVEAREELRGVLNSGHVRRSAVVIRTVGDQHEPRTFRTWAPKAIALIGQLPPTLKDRSIEISMRRRTSAEPVERLRLDQLDKLEPLRQRAWTWAQAHLPMLRGADPDMPIGLHDRAQDNWRSLFAIADAVGRDWPDRARAAALALSGAAQGQGEPAAVQLLADLRSLFEERGAEMLSTAEIVAHLVARDDRPWPEWYRSNPITKSGVARLLKPFGIHPRQLWIAGAKTRGYEAEAFRDAWNRYRVTDREQPVPLDKR